MVRIHPAVPHAVVVELVDTPDLESGFLKEVWVRVPPAVQIVNVIIMWTEPTDEIKMFFKDNDEFIKKYETHYFPETGKKNWVIVTTKGKFEFEQDFDFSFFSE